MFCLRFVYLYLYFMCIHLVHARTHPPAHLPPDPPPCPCIALLFPSTYNSVVSTYPRHGYQLMFSCSSPALAFSQEDLDPDVFLGAPRHVMEDVLLFIRVSFPLRRVASRPHPSASCSSCSSSSGIHRPSTRPGNLNLCYSFWGSRGHY